MLLAVSTGKYGVSEYDAASILVKRAVLDECRACAGLTQRRIMKTLSLPRFRRSVVPPCSWTA